MKEFIVATRPSLLAYTQTKQVVTVLEKLHPECSFTIQKISTAGDNVLNQPLTSFGGTGVFVKELEKALIDGTADIAVHSLKDVPSILPEQLMLAAFPTREDARDVIFIRNNSGIDSLQNNCIVGTGSPRRILQIKNLIPQAQFKDIRGNIDTRIQKLTTDDYDAIILAAAGLKRIGHSIPEQSYLPIDTCIPQIGQGALAIECRKNDTAVLDILNSINNIQTQYAILAERGYMRTIGGGCKFPLAAHATIQNGSVELRTMIGNHTNGIMITNREQALQEDAEELGISMAHKIIKEAHKQGIQFP